MSTMPVATRAAPGLRDLIDDGGIRALYQPIVELESGTPVAYQALARGPEGSELERSGALFAEASRLTLLHELDRSFRAAALEGALAGGLKPPRCLFVGVEPPTLGDDEELRSGPLRVVVELSSRGLSTRPGEVLAAVEWLRGRDCAVALGDVGVDDRSLALMPFLEPDVIKLDRGLVQERETSIATARAVNAVAAEAERSGATLLAEGIETDAHLLRARSMGATLGQGRLFGRPGPLPADPSPAVGQDCLPVRPVARPPLGTPFQLIADHRRLRRGDKHLLLALSRQLEAEAYGLSSEAVVLATFQDAPFFSPESRRYEELARHAALVGVLGMGIGEQPAPGVLGASLAPDDDLRGEWDVVVISPHFAGAFVGFDLHDAGPDRDRRFDVFVTYERELVTRAAQALMGRLLPAPA
jgi:EAL domain-containing protein (putative c-di-GMP-specific phosphodiesterase class I)